jgi:RNA polymerase sigma factor (sigma-70 family)
LNQAEANQREFSSLLKLAADGDRVAQEELCGQYEQQVRIVARVLLGNQLRPHLDSLDILQSVHRSLLMGIRDHKFDISSPEKLVALACTVVRRKVARKWRVHRRQKSLGFNDCSDQLLNTLSSMSNNEAAPAKVAEYNDAIAKLYNSLSFQERKMLERRLEGFTTGEVAEELGIHPVALRVRWSRLRQRLEEAGVFADWV